MSTRDDLSARLATLTHMVCKVLYWTCRGLGRKEVAETLTVVMQTVNSHMSNVYQKLGLVDMGRSQRATTLGQVYCKLVLEVISDPDRDCLRRRHARDDATPTPPSEEILALILEDEAEGVMPKMPEEVDARVGPAGAPAAREAPSSTPPPAGSRTRPPHRSAWRTLALILLGAFCTGTALWLAGVIRISDQTATPPADQPPAGEVAFVGTPAQEAGARTPDPTPEATATPTATATATATSTWTPTATATEEPTLTATPTTPPPSNTPNATETAQAVWAEQTRNAPTPTRTASPTPTATPSPTLTPTPSPTPTEIPDTPADAVLEVGEWWRERGVSLRLSDCVLSDTGWIELHMQLHNRTDERLLFRWSGEPNFELVDNTGYEYAVHWQYRGEVTDAAGAGERHPLIMPFYRSTMVYNDDHYFSPRVTDMYLTITDPSRITYAKWHIRVPK